MTVVQCATAGRRGYLCHVARSRADATLAAAVDHHPRACTCLPVAGPMTAGPGCRVASALIEGSHSMKNKLQLLAGAFLLSAVAMSAQAQEKRNAVSLFGN